MKRSTQSSASAEYVDPLHFPERRARFRHQPRSLVYVELDEGNGGIALNIGEDGLAVQAVMSLMDDFLPRVRFRLPESKEWIETTARVVWANEARKLLGLRFEELSEQSRQTIREWFERERSQNQDTDKDQDAEAPELLAEGLEGRIMPPAPMLVMPAPPISARSTSEAAVPEPENPPATATVDEAAAAPLPKEWVVPALNFPPESFRAPASNDLPGKWSIAVFFLFLATASLAAGWAVGRGTLDSGMQRLRKAVFGEGAASSASATNSAALVSQSHPSEIEIVNINGVHWTIPLAASGLAAGSQASAGAGSDAIPGSPEHGKANQSFRTWVLTAPVQPKAKASSGSDAAAPPALDGAIDSPQNAVSLTAQPFTIAAPPPPPQSVLRPAKLIRRVDPVYPPLAVSHRVMGTVKMHLIVGANGTVRDVHVIYGPPMLVDAAVKAASQWLYSPMLMNGKPADSEVDIDLSFKLP